MYSVYLNNNLPRPLTLLYVGMACGGFFFINKVYKAWQEYQLSSCSCINSEFRKEFSRELFKKISHHVLNKNKKITIVSYCSGRLLQEAKICKKIFKLDFLEIDLYCIDQIYENVFSNIAWRKKIKNYVQTCINKKIKILTVSLFPTMEQFLRHKDVNIDVLIMIDPSCSKLVTYGLFLKAMDYCNTQSVIGILDKEVMFQPTYNFYKNSIDFIKIHSDILESGL